MAKKVRVQVMGGAEQVFENINTLREIKQKVNAQNHAATINGEPAGDDSELEDYAYVALAPAIKGA